MLLTMLDKLDNFATPLLTWIREEPPNAEDMLRARAWAARREPRPSTRHARPGQPCEPREAREPCERDARVERLARVLAQRVNGAELHALRSTAPRLSALLTALRSRPLAADRIRELLHDAVAPREQLERAAELLAPRRNDAYLGMLLAEAYA